MTEPVRFNLRSIETWTQPFDATGQVKHLPAVLLLMLVGFALFVITIWSALVLGFTVAAPTPPKGWGAGLDANGPGPGDYEAAVGRRKPIAAYFAEIGVAKDSTVPMVNFSVATANFGGIYTENRGGLNPWIGSVSADAARLQVEAGARAIVLDVWPDPADTSRAVVASMLDMRSSDVLKRWKSSWGLGDGLTGNYSNWQLLTRNVVPVGDVLAAAIQSAFQSGAGQQNGDPFFVILNLHGPMTAAYLNSLGATVRQALGTYAMPSQWGHAANQSMLCTAPVSEFMGQAFVIVNPDIAVGPVGGTPRPSPILGPNAPRPIRAPNAPQFIRQFMATAMGEVANAIQTTPGSIVYEPGSTGSLTAASQPNCTPGGDAITPTEAGFCVIQPSIGGASTDNSQLFTSQSFEDCVGTGAQFVAMNLFSPNGGDSELKNFFKPDYFGTYSFRRTRV